MAPYLRLLIVVSLVAGIFAASVPPDVADADNTATFPAGAVHVDAS